MTGSITRNWSVAVSSINLVLAIIIATTGVAFWLGGLTTTLEALAKAAVAEAMDGVLGHGAIVAMYAVSSNPIRQKAGWSAGSRRAHRTSEVDFFLVLQISWKRASWLGNPPRTGDPGRQAVSRTGN